MFSPGGRVIILDVEKMTEAEINQLFASTLSGDYDDESAWEAVHALRRTADRRVFDQAVAWCRSGDPEKRARGADVVAQIGKTVDHPENAFPEESYSVIAELLDRESNDQALAAGIAALGHIGNPRSIPLIAGFRSHASDAVRFDVAFALGSFPDDPLSVATLLLLMEDSDCDVRDWATFGLGVLGSTDSAEIRDALVARLSDADEDVREEAMVGLAKRKDDNVLPTLLAALSQYAVSDRIIEVAYLMLGMENERNGWVAKDYTAALRTAFGGDHCR